MANWQDHANLLFAAQGARRMLDPNRELAATLLAQSGRERPSDPLEAAFVEAMLRERRDRQERAARQADERDRWEHALQLQESQNRREDVVDERNWQRGESGRKLTEDFQRTQIEGTKRGMQTPVETRTPAEIEAAAAEREKRRYNRETYGTETPGDGGQVPLDKETRQAIRNSAIQRIGQRVESGEISPDQADREIAGLGDPKAALRTAMPGPKTTAEDELKAVVQANVNQFKGDWLDTSADNLFDSKRGIFSDPALAQAMDRTITRLLKQGKKPADIGWMARQAIENQKTIDPSTLDNPHWFGSDKYATHYYGEKWRERAESLLPGMRP